MFPLLRCCPSFWRCSHCLCDSSYMGSAPCCAHPSRGPKHELRLGWPHVIPLVFSTGKMRLPWRPRGSLGAQRTKMCPLVWKVWCVTVLPPKTAEGEPASLRHSPFSSRMEMKISLSCHVRQEHVLWGHITTRYTSLTSASPPTHSHLEPVTWTMQQIDLLLSYHSSALFPSKKKSDAEHLRNFQENSCWISLTEAVLNKWWSLITLHFLEMIKDELLMKYIRNPECGWRTNLKLKKAIIDWDLVNTRHGKAQACILNIDHKVSTQH